MMDANAAIRALCATGARYTVCHTHRWSVDMDPGEHSYVGYGSTLPEAAETALHKWADAESRKYPWVVEANLSDSGTWHVCSKDNRTLHDTDFHRVCQLLKPDPEAEVIESWRTAVRDSGAQGDGVPSPIFPLPFVNLMAKNNIRFVHKKED